MATRVAEKLEHLFNERQFHKVLDLSKENEITPNSSPAESYIVRHAVSTRKTRWVFTMVRE